MNKWLLAVCLFWSASQAGPVYRWVDENGQVNYSDRPGPDAVPMELPTDATLPDAGLSATAPGAGPHSTAPEAGLSSTAPNAGLSTPATRPSADGTASAPAAAYESLAVIQPAPHETLWGTAGAVQVAIEISPGLKPPHRFGLYLDGALTDLRTRATRFGVADVHRGEHTLRAVVLDEEGDELLQSAPVTFFVQQTSVHYPRNPGGAR